jgi:hypothetical protein
MSEGRLLITAGGSLVTALRGLGGGITVITAGDPAYDAARAVWNGAIDRRPYCIVTCHSATDVARVVHACTVHQVSVTVRGGGHSVSGLAVKDGAVLIDLCDDSVTLTADRQTVVVGGGATWAMVDAVTAPAEVYVPAGLVSHTGWCTHSHHHHHHHVPWPIHSVKTKTYQLAVLCCHTYSIALTRTQSPWMTR